MLAFNIFFVRSTSTSAAVIVLAANIVTMNGILDDALSGLLLLHEGIDSNNDSKDHCTTQSSNDSSTTPPSNDSNATPTSDNSSATPTSSLPKKKRKCKKRGRLAVSDNPFPRTLGPPSCASCSAATTKIPPHSLPPVPPPLPVVYCLQQPKPLQCHWYLQSVPF